METVTKEKLNELYWEQGFTLAQVGAYFERKSTWARKQMDKHGIARRSCGGLRKLPDCATLRNLYVDEGKNLREIAGMYGAHLVSVSDNLERCDIDRRPGGRVPIYIDNLRELYEEKSVVDIANELGLNQATIYKAMERQGIERDSHHRNSALPIHPFFLKETPEKYYVLGFFFADGNISATWTVTLSQTKRAILDKIGPLVDREVGPSTNTNLLILGGKNLALYLKENYGLLPRKSKTMPWPDIPEDYMHDFIRGFFDGDGSVGAYRSKQGKGVRRTVSFTCGSQDFIQGLRDILENLGFGYQKIYPVKGKGSAYRIIYSGKCRLGKMFEYLYYSDCLCQQSKLEKFEKTTCKRLDIEQLKFTV